MSQGKKLIDIDESIVKKREEAQKDIENPKSDLSEIRKRDYKIYKSCVHTAFYNDIKKNILYTYNKIRQKMPEANISNDLLKNSLISVLPFLFISIIYIYFLRRN